jgi:RNA polymerase sigma-70 factor (ECF subfamily)
MVLAARQVGNEQAGRVALEDLCKMYWQPLYGFCRRRGASPADAADLVQGFFASLLKEDLFGKANADHGKLRSFLLGALQRYQRNEWRAAAAEKRGGGQVPLSMDAEESELAFQLEDPSAISPEQAYEKQCALSLLETALQKLRAEHVATGREKMFELLRPLISPVSGDEGSASHEDLAAGLGMTPEASRAAVYRMRKRFRELLREAVADTLASPDSLSVDEELESLRRALTSAR